MKFILTTWLFLCSLIAVAQSVEKKYEREKRIKPSEAPDGVRELVSPYLNEARRVRYLEELDGQSTSYEVKFIYYKNKFSVEFSDDGRLEDVEVIRCFTALPQDVQNRIVDHLYYNENFKIKKAQKQFQSDELTDSELLEVAVKNINTDDIRYELIVQVKKSGDWATYEMLFDDNGKFLSQRTVVARSEDHLLY